MCGIHPDAVRGIGEDDVFDIYQPALLGVMRGIRSTDDVVNGGEVDDAAAASLLRQRNRIFHAKENAMVVLVSPMELNGISGQMLAHNP
ncbi:hypothetical protein [Caballeronia sp. DA-9]|uniref:hypothetical protein n=1 Tax=Caballeronia sp. DA-9 TaxID=3436237 RepID=UPI003F666191